jgi:hypothetical protein
MQKKLLTLTAVGLVLLPTQTSCMKQSCMQETCSFCGCCLADLSKIIDFGEAALQIAIDVDPRTTDKAIMSTIVALFKVISPELLSLAKACKDKAAQIPLEHQEKLKALGLIDEDGRVTDPKVVNTVNAAIKIIEK